MCFADVCFVAVVLYFISASVQSSDPNCVIERTVSYLVCAFARTDTHTCVHMYVGKFDNKSTYLTRIQTDTSKRMYICT